MRQVHCFSLMSTKFTENKKTTVHNNTIQKYYYSNAARTLNFAYFCIVSREYVDFRCSSEFRLGLTDFRPTICSFNNATTDINLS